MSDVPNLWYFAYGANMDRATLVERRKIVPRSVEPAVLRGFELVFDQRGIPWIEPAFANLNRADGGAVHGVVYGLSATQLEELDALEGGGAYEHLVVDVELARGGSVSATAYVTDERQQGHLPSERYLALLLRGAREHGLPSDWLRRLEDQPTAGLGPLSFAAPAVMMAFEIAFRAQLAARRWLER